MALVAGSTRAAALVGPDIGQGALLADPSVVLPSDFQRLAAGVIRNRAAHQVGQVLVKLYLTRIVYGLGRLIPRPRAPSRTAAASSGPAKAIRNDEAARDSSSSTSLR